VIVQAALSCEALGPAAVVRAHGVEAMNALPAWTVDVLSDDAAVDTAKLVGAPATLAFGDDAGGARGVPLLVREASYAGPHRDGHRYQIALCPPLAKLVLRAGYRIFQNVTTQEIVAKLLGDAGVSTTSIAWRLADRYQKRTYCVQYRETEWELVERLLADEGINVWFDQTDDGAPRIVFGDGAGAHDSIEGPTTVPYQDASGMAGSAASFFSLERTCELTHDRVALRDYDVRHPDVPIDGAAGDGALEWCEYPALVMHGEAAAARAQVRLDQFQRLRVRLEGRSACARLQPGRIVRIEGAADDVFSGAFLIVEAEHTIVAPSRSDGSAARPYANRVVLVPFDKQRPFRPEQPRRAPHVDTLETAVVTGPAGEEIHVNDLGDVKVRFHWDRSGVGDDKSSRWVRTLQMNMHGSMLLPRMGWEVPVVYFDGNPDRPLVLGRLYDGSAPPPYSLPAKKATSTIQSATSPSNGTTQEIRLADDAGSQETFIHATKDQSVSVGGTNTVTVGANETHDVQKSSQVSITAAQTVSVGGSQSVSVGADLGISVKGARAESVGGMETIGVTGSYNVACTGAYTEVVGGLYGLQCNQSNTVVQGAFTQTVGGVMALTAGLGTHNSVAAARVEAVGGAASFTAADVFADSVKGAKRITAGASKDDAGTNLVTNVAGVGSIKVGGTAKIEAGGLLAVQAPKITVNVGGSITAKGGATLKIGGKVKVSGGKAKFDAGSTKKTSTSKVGS
jgi:type VI secretion system secreted protein VgrG